MKEFSGNCAFVDTSNEKFNYIKDCKGYLRVLVDLSAVFDYMDPNYINRPKSLITSVVSSIEEEGDLIILKTMNSTYTFKKEINNGSV